MFTSPGLAAWVAHLAFWLLLAGGWISGELGTRGIRIAVGVWLAACIGMAFIPYGAVLFPSVVAVIDIVLVLLIFKGDVELR